LEGKKEARAEGGMRSQDDFILIFLTKAVVAIPFSSFQSFGSSDYRLNSKRFIIIWETPLTLISAYG